MTPFETLRNNLADRPSKWMITGVAGFIGSNLLKALLGAGQYVVGLDNFSTGHKYNLDRVEAAATPEQWSNFRFHEGDIRDLEACREAIGGVKYVLHQAALGSVPRSIQDPIPTNQSNIDGFLNMLIASRDAGVKRFVYASSSSVYGDDPALPKVEGKIGRPLSPYAVSKLANELYAQVFSSTYGLQTVGLRYFNIFGPHQDPNGAYAAVIPRWISAMVEGGPAFINGDGTNSRDFCFVANAIQANLLAATFDASESASHVFNIAAGERTNLQELYSMIRSELQAFLPHLRIPPPQYRDPRPGDVPHSLANLEKAKLELGYQPSHTIAQGLRESIRWFIEDLAAQGRIFPA